MTRASAARARVCHQHLVYTRYIILFNCLHPLKYFLTIIYIFYLNLQVAMALLFYVYLSFFFLYHLM